MRQAIIYQLAQKRVQSYNNSYFTWVQDVWSVRGQPLDFTHHKYLVQIYQDQSPVLVIMKSAQSGVSERVISESFWVADQKGKNVLYTFPAQGQLSDFVTGRVDPVIGNSPYLQARVVGTIVDEKEDGIKKRPDRTGMKQVGKGFIYFRGSQNEKQIISVDADMVVVDERDRFIQSSIPYIDKRLLHSSLKWRRYVSTPTIPGKFIHRDFLDSDQHEWFITCDACGEEQCLDFWKNVAESKTNQGHYETVCWKCHTPIDRLKDGRWIPQNPDSQIRGYHINGLYNPMISIDEVHKQSLATDIFSLTQFYNQTLGLPYEAEGARVTQQALDACRRLYSIPYVDENGRPPKGCTAGADIGAVINVVVGKTEGSGDDEKTRYVYIGTVNHFTGPQDSLEWVMENFDIETLVVDMMPETRSVMDLVQKYPGRVYGCRYPSRRFPVGNYMEWKLDDSEVQVDRTISLDYYVSEIDRQKIILPDNADSIPNFYDQMKSSIRVLDHSESTGNVTARWEEAGPDHYFHAGNYERIARQRGGAAQSFLNLYRNVAQQAQEAIPSDITSIKRLVEEQGTRM